MNRREFVLGVAISLFIVVVASVVGWWSAEWCDGRCVTLWGLLDG